MAGPCRSKPTGDKGVELWVSARVGYRFDFNVWGQELFVLPQPSIGAGRRAVDARRSTTCSEQSETKRSPVAQRRSLALSS